MQGKAISDGPLPFLFGAKADKLKRRYFLRIITPQDAQGQVWLEAWPRFAYDAEDFTRAQVILNTATMLPMAIQTYQPNGKSRTVYQFGDSPRVNSKDPLRHLDPLNILKQDPFRPTLPRGWTKVVETQPMAQGGAQGGSTIRR